MNYDGTNAGTVTIKDVSNSSFVFGESASANEVKVEDDDARIVNKSTTPLPLVLVAGSKVTLKGVFGDLSGEGIVELEDDDTTVETADGNVDITDASGGEVKKDTAKEAATKELLNNAVAALGNELIGAYNYPVGEVTADGLKVTASYTESELEEYVEDRKGDGKTRDILAGVMDDFARFAKNLKTDEITEIEFNKLTFEWKSDLDSESKWNHNGEGTLVSHFTSKENGVSFVDQIKAQKDDENFTNFTFENFTFTINDVEFTYVIDLGEETNTILNKFVNQKWNN